MYIEDLIGFDVIIGEKVLGKVTGANPKAIASTINKMNLTYPAYLYE